MTTRKGKKKTVWKKKPKKANAEDKRRKKEWILAVSQQHGEWYKVFRYKLWCNVILWLKSATINLNNFSFVSFFVVGAMLLLIVCHQWRFLFRFFFLRNLENFGLSLIQALFFCFFLFLLSRRLTRCQFDASKKIRWNNVTQKVTWLAQVDFLFRDRSLWAFLIVNRLRTKASINCSSRRETVVWWYENENKGKKKKWMTKSSMDEMINLICTVRMRRGLVHWIMYFFPLFSCLLLSYWSLAQKRQETKTIHRHLAIHIFISIWIDCFLALSCVFIFHPFNFVHCLTEEKGSKNDENPIFFFIFSPFSAHVPIVHLQRNKISIQNKFIWLRMCVCDELTFSLLFLLFRCSLFFFSSSFSCIIYWARNSE